MKLLISLFTASFATFLFVNTAAAQGALTNGWTHSGTIAPVGDSDTWTFSANAGDSIVIRVGEITQTNSFSPRIRLFNPNSVQQAVATASSATEIAVTATNTGTFTVIVDDNAGTTATGTYRLTLVKTGEPIMITPGDEGGPMTNGYDHQGSLPVGDLDAWTFTASIGDAIVVKVGQITDTNSFDPWVRLYGPDGKLISGSFDTSAAEVTTRATNSGTFLVVIANNPYNNNAGNGTYQVKLAKTGDPIVLAPGDEGGPMINGYAHQGNLPIGDLDTWNFTANAGDAIVVKVGQITDTNNFDPWVRLYGPDGALISSSADTSAAEVTTRATNSGTFLVVIDNNPYYSDAGSGTYRVKLVKTGSAIVLPPGDEGGPMTNGYTHYGNLPIGDLDTWTFTANTGDNIILKVGQITDTNNFDPWIRLYGSNGVLIASSSDTSAAEVTTRATNSGTFLVVIGNNPYYSDAGSGSYRVKLAKTCSAIVLAPGDEGGPMTNGYSHYGNLPLGDLNLWNFTASAGDAIVIKAGQITQTNNFDPWVRLYGPDGALIASSSDTSAAEVTVRATNSGTFLVVIGNDPYYTDAASGTYLLTLDKTGDAIVISPGDEGGPMTNGYTHQGNLPVGDLDAWTFTANTGDAIILKAGQIMDAGSFDPWVRLYGPDGMLIGSSSGAAAAEVTTRATNSGVFLVVIGNNPYYSDAGSGTYLLTLAKTGSQLMVSPGGVGGSLTGAGSYNASLPLGGVDAWTFTLCAGEHIDIRVDEITQTNIFDPWVRLYGPNGLLIASSFGTTFGEVSLTSTNRGSFLVLISNNPYNNAAGSGTFALTVNGLSDGFKTCAPVITGTIVDVGGVGGTPGTDGVLFTSTNVATHFGLWTPILTNAFDPFGVFSYTNKFNPAEQQRYFRLSDL